MQLSKLARIPILSVFFGDAEELHKLISCATALWESGQLELLPLYVRPGWNSPNLYAVCELDEHQAHHGVIPDVEFPS
jgi:hypothetical protein